MRVTTLVALVALCVVGAGLILTEAPKVSGEAAYSPQIDQLVSLKQKLLAGDGATDDQFGTSVALSDDTLVIGASADDIGPNQNQGSVYVFTRSGGTPPVWTQQAKLTASDGAANDRFGFRVAVSGDTLAVGVSGDTIGANSQQGSTYVFTRSGGVWTQQQKLVAADGAANDHFGSGVAVSGDTLVAGANGDRIGPNGSQGSAYVYTRSGSVWTLQQKLTAADGATGDFFGEAVAVSGDTLVVGAVQSDIGANFDQGAAYVFTRSLTSGGAVWTQQQKITSNDNAPNALFGSAVAISGDTVAVGAKLDVSGLGSTYVFTRSLSSGGGVWNQQQKLVAADGEASDRFGAAVAISGDTLVAGAAGSDIGANQNQGSAYVYTRSGEIWTLQKKITADGDAPFDAFGVSVAVDGDTLVAGANGENVNTNLDQGAVYLFEVRSCAALTFTPDTLPDGAQGSSYQQQISVSGGVGPYQFAIFSWGMPPGLSLMTNGMLSGVPTTPGSYQFKVRATDSNTQCSTVKKYTLKIKPPCPSIMVDPPAPPKGVVGVRYRQALTASGGAEPYTFGVKGKLPPGLSLSADGVLGGTPTQAGNYSFWLLVADGNSCEAVGAYSITIMPGNTAIGGRAAGQP
jgi:hypothetical protein